jgi:hypothetical protein
MEEVTVSRRELGVVPVVTLFVLSPVSSAADQESNEEGQSDRRITLEFAYGWTTTWGNDVHVGDRATVKPFLLVFDAESSLEPVSTPMDAVGMPLLRATYRGGTWGLSGNLWRMSTGGSADGSFFTSRERPEIVRIWSEWRGDFDRETSYTARNDLSLFSGRVELTHTLNSDVLLSLGLQMAKFENERAESINVSAPGVHDEMTGFSHIEGWLVGPAFGLQGTASPTSSTALGVSFSQAFLFADLENDATWDWVQSFRGEEEPPIHIDTLLPSSVVVPVSEAHVSFQIALGDSVSLGAIFFLSAWYDMPTAREFSYPLERWEERNRTLVFATVGPVVTVRF